MASQLPPNASPLQRAAASAGRYDIPMPLADLYNPHTCPAAVLPWLAWAWHLTDEEGWALATTDQSRRALLAESHELHRKKGTRWAVLTALARAGYPGCDIVEHRDIVSRWLQVGGELLDGAGALDGSGTLAPPYGDFRFITTSWAENIIRVNFSDADWSLANQRNVIAVAQEWAPLRSAFVALIATAVWTWSSQITFSGTQKLSAIFDGCRRHPVARFDTLDGCDLIGGEDIPSYLSGDEALDGRGILSGSTPAGEALDGGNLGLAMRLRHQVGFSGGGLRHEPAETLGSGDRLDGGALLCGELLDGSNRLNSGSLWYPSLEHPDDFIDGTSHLGEVSGPPTLWFGGRITIRNGHTITQETL